MPNAESAEDGPKGLENIAQALAWVGQRNTLSPVGAEETQALDRRSVEH
jgi:hypothetical protein